MNVFQICPPYCQLWEILKKSLSTVVFKYRSTSDCLRYLRKKQCDPFAGSGPTQCTVCNWVPEFTPKRYMPYLDLLSRFRRFRGRNQPTDRQTHRQTDHAITVAMRCILLLCTGWRGCGLNIILIVSK